MADIGELPEAEMALKYSIAEPDDHISVKSAFESHQLRTDGEDIFPDGTLWGWLAVVGVCVQMLVLSGVLASFSQAFVRHSALRSPLSDLSNHGV